MPLKNIVDISIVLQVSKQHPKIYISPLLLQQLHEQYSSAEKNSENSTENLSNFCKDATRVFSEALIIKLDAAAVNQDIMVTEKSEMMFIIIAQSNKTFGCLFGRLSL